MLYHRPHHNSKSLTKALCATLLTFTLSVVFVASAHAATISIAPTTSKVTVGNIVNVKVLVGTQGKSINNTEATIAFPADLLEVLSITKSSSIFNLWVEEPKFSNPLGSITFNGGLPTPGYVGEGGEVASITFKAKKTGNASIVFVDAAIRENNGLGTDILTSKQGGVVVIESAAQLEVPAVTTSANTVPARPIITSATHPQQDTWYSLTSTSFGWVMPSDVTSIQTLLGTSPDSTPTVTYDSSVSQRVVNNLTDGVLYFHLRYMNSVGWGPTAHYKVQIDSTPPDKFSVTVRDEGVRRIARFTATDALSGIDTYRIKVDGEEVARIKKDQVVDGMYELPVQRPGEHKLSVIAYDKAANQTEAITVFVSPQIAAPILDVRPEYVTKGDVITVVGATNYPGAQVLTYTSVDDEKPRVYTSMTDKDGSFTVITDEFLKKGLVTISSQIVFTDDIKSLSSIKVTRQINDTQLVRTTKSISYTLALIILMILLLLTLLFVTYLGWHKFFGLKRKISRDLDETVGGIHKAMMHFKEELSKQLLVLEKVREDRELNRKEEKIFKELQNNIDSIDQFIEKKLKKIK